MAVDRDIDLMIIGAQKAGTTSLKNYLGQHPSCATHLQTELSYFIVREEYEKGHEYEFKWYFPNVQATQKLIAKSAGMYYNDTALRRLHEHNPDCKLVFILRNPVDRAYSSYLMERDNGYMREDWNHIVQSIKKYEQGETDHMFRLFIYLSLYSVHLEKIFTFFPAEQVKILQFETFAKKPVDVCRNIFGWLGVDPGFIPDTSKKYNATAAISSRVTSRIVKALRYEQQQLKTMIKKILPSRLYSRTAQMLLSSASKQYEPEPMAPEVREILKSFFHPYNERLKKQTHLSLEGWEV